MRRDNIIYGVLFKNRFGGQVAVGEALVKSKERVKDFGEVYTPARIVNDMLNCVEECSETQLRTTFLEPACGDGNFLVQILARKLEIARKLCGENVENYDKYVAFGLMAVYGVDIQHDNVVESIERMLLLIETGLDHKNGAGPDGWIAVENEYLHGAVAYEEFTGHELSSDVRNKFKWILENNIIEGNFLTGMLWSFGEETTRQLLFTEYLSDDMEMVTMNKYSVDIIKGNGIGACESYNATRWNALDKAGAKVNNNYTVGDDGEIEEF